MFPVSARQPLILGITAGTLIVASIFTIAHRLADVPCVLYLGILMLCDNVIATSFVLRALYVLFQLRIVEVVNKITEWTATDEVKAAGKNDWYMKNAKRVLSNRFYLICYIIDLAVVLIVVVATVGAASSGSAGGFGEEVLDSQCRYSSEASNPINIMRIVTLAVKCLISGYIALRLSFYGADTGLVKSELLYTVCTAPALLISHFVVQGVVMSNTSQTGADVSASLYMGMIIVVGMGAVAHPVYMSYFIDKETETAYYMGRQPDISNLADIINSKIGYNAFVQFLKSEFSEENILFWREVQTFVNKCQSLKQGFSLEEKDMNAQLAAKMVNREVAAELCNTAIQIFENYCKRGAPAQINISDTVLQELSTQLSNLKADRAETVLDKISNLFDSVKGQVFELMDKDSFARFRQSPLYNQLRSRMVTSGWIDTSGGETLDSFDLPVGLITVRDADEERQKALERKQQLAIINPEAIKQAKKDQRASHMLTVAAQMNRKHIMSLSSQSHLKSPVDASDVYYPYTLEDQMEAGMVGPPASSSAHYHPSTSTSGSSAGPSANVASSFVQPRRSSGNQGPGSSSLTVSTSSHHRRSNSSSSSHSFHEPGTPMSQGLTPRRTAVAMLPPDA